MRSGEGRRPGRRTSCQGAEGRARRRPEEDGRRERPGVTGVLRLFGAFHDDESAVVRRRWKPVALGSLEVVLEALALVFQEDSTRLLIVVVEVGVSSEARSRSLDSLKLRELVSRERFKHRWRRRGWLSSCSGWRKEMTRRHGADPHLAVGRRLCLGQPTTRDDSDHRRDDLHGPRRPPRSCGAQLDPRSRGPRLDRAAPRGDAGSRVVHRFVGDQRWGLASEEQAPDQAPADRDAIHHAIGWVLGRSFSRTSTSGRWRCRDLPRPDGRSTGQAVVTSPRVRLAIRQLEHRSGPNDGLVLPFFVLVLRRPSDR